MKIRWSAVLGLGLLAWGGCQSPREPEPAQRPIARASTPQPPPETREAFVGLLQPLPAPAIQIVYEVEGPANLSGRLEMLIQRGGLRREDWAVSLPIPGAEPVEINGRTIRTLDRVWSVSDGQDAVLSRSPLGTLASAYLQLPLDRREQIAAALRQWHRDLEQARAGAQGTTVAGEHCLPLDMAAQSVCLWREAGLPLLYRSEGFVLRAVAVDRDPSVDPSTFELPEGAKDAPLTTPEHGLATEAALEALGRGDVPAVLLSLQSVPSLEVPHPRPASSPAPEP